MSLLKYTVFLSFIIYSSHAGILYPRDSETRTTLSLDGIWDFTVGDPNAPARGYVEKWYKSGLKSAEDIPIQLIPVPSSFNDITTSWELRDFFGVVWYETKFFAPQPWNNQRVWLRFSSATYYADVWINGEAAVSHEVGHLPFQAEVTSLLVFGGENTISVGLNNTLSKITIPQGQFGNIDSGRYVNTFNFDFFNYAGIDRPVVLYTTPKTYINDINIHSTIDGEDATVTFEVITQGDAPASSKVTILDEDNQEVVSGTSLSGTLNIVNAKLWWPNLMDPNPGYLYKLQIELLGDDGSLIDKYIQKFGIRTLAWNENSLLINNRPVYLRGFGRHEESEIRGQGLDWPIILRDFNLVKWAGANALRSSNFPYSEEVMDMADELGIMIIDESSAVNTGSFNNLMLQAHKKSLVELVARDKNRPSVIAWSVAANARTDQDQSLNYFTELVNQIKDLDISRPVTAINIYDSNTDKIGQLLDIACFNLFTAWDDNGGDFDIINPDVLNVAQNWHAKHNIPVIMTEYGADSMEGLHLLPAYIWTEDYQVELLSKHFEVFDQLRAQDWFIGEFVWSFADFKAKQGFGVKIFGQSTNPVAPIDEYFVSKAYPNLELVGSPDFLKVGATKKGVFTRNRQPKAAAFLLRQRYWTLAQELDNAALPDDLYNYVAQKKTLLRGEL